jgi:8-oxo-dGTP pyrophosphatase MutT (NUDIX family)
MLTLTDIERRIGPLLLDSHRVTLYAKSSSTSVNDGLSRTAAVLIIVHSKSRTPHVLLTRRSSKLKYHTSEISFPGGQYSCAIDPSLLDTALRETTEEVGLCFTAQDILGRLRTVYTLTSNFTIVPFITIQKNIPEPKILANEVDCIVDVPLQETLATFEPDIEHYHISQKGVYKFTYGEFVIWGATARIFKQLYDCLCIT